ncbi:hypothetical protein HCG51_18810 [Tolypothrix sp. PCC 7910]|uniref:hypothetical protein n=1 Tax=Tolypothrix sp. PCC 7910 TaxID=2099387 RepID=UPI0014277659|nr:hypothetical protein [Tolypothrix sp. PCC 7910]QIR38548.1 hypothetical protein HCG51_18810 [Tolypothrix sp. PCC 7910]
MSQASIAMEFYRQPPLESNHLLQHISLTYITYPFFQTVKPQQSLMQSFTNPQRIAIYQFLHFRL